MAKPKKLGLIVSAILLVAASLVLGVGRQAPESVFDLATSGVAANGEWVPVLREFDGHVMALVPAGTFAMGGTEYTDEKPIHEVRIETPFWIDVYEVTTAQFAAFMNTPAGAGHKGCQWVTGYDTFEEQFVQVGGQWIASDGYEDSAVFGVTWYEASAFCECRGARLATEAEWEYAARGPDGLLYPWGNEFVAENVAKYQGGMPMVIGSGAPLTVGTKPAGASWVGAMDLSGNADEWVSSLYWPYPYDASDGRESMGNEGNSTPRSFRGGAWYHPNWIDPLRGNDRFCLLPHLTMKFLGIRCVRDFPP